MVNFEILRWSRQYFNILVKTTSAITVLEAAFFNDAE